MTHSRKKLRWRGIKTSLPPFCHPSHLQENLGSGWTTPTPTLSANGLPCQKPQHPHTSHQRPGRRCGHSCKLTTLLVFNEDKLGLDMKQVSE